MGARYCLALYDDDDNESIDSYFHKREKRNPYFFSKIMLLTLFCLFSYRYFQENEITRLKEQHKNELEDNDFKLKKKYDDKISELNTAPNENFKVEKENLRKSMEKYVDQMHAHYKTKIEEINNEHASEISKLRQSEKSKDEKLEKLTSQYMNKIEEIKKNYLDEVSRFSKSEKSKDEKLAKMIGQLKALKNAVGSLRKEKGKVSKNLKNEMEKSKKLEKNLDAIKKELKDTFANNSETAAALIQEREKLQKENSDIKREMGIMKAERDSSKNEVEKLTEKLGTLTRNFNAFVEEQKEQDAKIQIATKQESMLTQSEAEVNELREQINKLKLDLLISTHAKSIVDDMIEDLQWWQKNKKQDPHTLKSIELFKYQRLSYIMASWETLGETPAIISLWEEIMEDTVKLMAKLAKLVKEVQRGIEVWSYLGETTKGFVRLKKYLPSQKYRLLN